MFRGNYNNFYRMTNLLEIINHIARVYENYYVNLKIYSHIHILYFYYIYREIVASKETISYT